MYERYSEARNIMTQYWWKLFWNSFGYAKPVLDYEPYAESAFKTSLYV